MNTEEKEKIDRMTDACQSALNWFKQFGYNAYGIACQDDVPDHEEVMQELKSALEFMTQKDK